MNKPKRKSSVPELNCPNCGNAILWNDDYPHRPFCSKRCKQIDFGDWASESHAIPGEPVELDDNDTSASEQWH